LGQSAGHAEQPTTQVTVGDLRGYAPQLGVNLAEFFQRHCPPTARPCAASSRRRRRSTSSRMTSSAASRREAAATASALGRARARALRRRGADGYPQLFVMLAAVSGLAALLAP
jgi:hypothetical protein